MALDPRDVRHAGQIRAGTTGRRSGHRFERELAQRISLVDPGTLRLNEAHASHIIDGDAAVELVQYICRSLGLRHVRVVSAEWLGGRATVREPELVSDYTVPSRLAKGSSKSDVAVYVDGGGRSLVVGVSTKTCTTRAPTNAQLYFSTATAFCALLRRRGIEVSERAETAMRMFCGDAGYRPADMPDEARGRSPQTDASRWFWEELPRPALKEWAQILGGRQADVTRILLRDAYDDDPLPPDFVLHGRGQCRSIADYRMAVFTVEELVALSCAYSGFGTREYRIRKGTFRGDPSPHRAPRFGYVQFQRGGQRQHPTQLQFNLQAGYFNKLPAQHARQ